MAIFNSYVSLPEGTRYTIGKCWKRNLSGMLGDLYAPIHKISDWEPPESFVYTVW